MQQRKALVTQNRLIKQFTTVKRVFFLNKNELFRADSWLEAQAWLEV